MFLIICLAAFTLLLVDNESMVSVLRLVDSSMVVIMKKLLARMTVTRRTKAKSAKSCTLRDCPSAWPGL